MSEGDADTGTLGIQVSGGNVLLKAAGSTADITLNADLILTNGNLSLNAAQDILQNADVTSQGGTSKTIDYLAGRHITLSQDNGTTTRTITSNGSDISLVAPAAVSPWRPSPRVA